MKKSDLYMEKRFIVCMKGVEIWRGKGVCEVLSEEIGEDWNVGVWVGGGDVEDLLKGIGNWMVIWGKNRDMSKDIMNIFRSDLIGF